MTLNKSLAFGRRTGSCLVQSSNHFFFISGSGFTVDGKEGFDPCVEGLLFQQKAHK